MKKVFLDSSVLVSASASLTGASAYILGLCRLEKLKGYVSKKTIGEANKNINLKLSDQSKRRFISYLKLANLSLINKPALEEIVYCGQVINEKDAPILAAAINSKADFLITLDRKHFLKPEVMEFSRPLKIISPGEFIQKHLRSE